MEYILIVLIAINGVTTFFWIFYMIFASKEEKRLSTSEFLKLKKTIIKDWQCKLTIFGKILYVLIFTACISIAMIPVIIHGLKYIFPKIIYK
ncbi:hypothetical protein M2146_001100 [Lachnospiraceae bacterium PF1-22]